MPQFSRFARPEPCSGTSRRLDPTCRTVRRSCAEWRPCDNPPAADPAPATPSPPQSFTAPGTSGAGTGTTAAGTTTTGTATTGTTGATRAGAGSTASSATTGNIVDSYGQRRGWICRPRRRRRRVALSALPCRFICLEARLVAGPFQFAHDLANMLVIARLDDELDLRGLQRKLSECALVMYFFDVCAE